MTDGVRTRDPDAIAACYEALADPLFRYLVGLCGDWTLAEDLVEATFVELIESAPDLTGGATGLRRWLFRAARNNLFDARRKASRRGDQSLEDLELDGPGDDPNPEEAALAGEESAVVQAALAQLSPDQREVLLLRFAGELTGPEIAELTGRTVGSIKALQHRGLAALARVLDTDGGGGAESDSSGAGASQADTASAEERTRPP